MKYNDAELFVTVLKTARMWHRMLISLLNIMSSRILITWKRDENQVSKQQKDGNEYCTRMIR